MLRHVNNTIPSSATQSRNRVLVTKTHTALEGGNPPLADFHVTPPLGRSMMGAAGLVAKRRNEG
jgi:hypothetical protein